MKTERKCHGTGKAVGHGCGKMVPQIHNGQANRIYGIGKSCGCYPKWLMTTPEGLKKIESSISIGRKKVEKAESNKWTEEKKVIQEKIETKTDVEKKLQKEINLIVRLLDKGHPCISSGRSLGKNYDAGHLYSCGSNPNIRFHLLNVFAQSVHDNQWKSGNQLDFIENIGNTFGADLKDYCLSLKGLPSLNLEKHELKDRISIARGIVKWLKLQDRKFTTEERIELRKKFNQELGIY